MMDLNRRKFFALGAATGLWAAVPQAVAAALTPATALPVLMGDGINDDTAALNAAFKGQPFEDCSGGMVTVQDGVITVRGGTFRTTGALYMRPGGGHHEVRLENAWVKSSAEVAIVASPADGSHRIAFDGVHIDTSNTPIRPIEIEWARTHPQLTRW